ncbi:hypothetical protein HDU99_010651 [Rhizoclosmatium hyalinum]|nr:hypothetical protein HDU99_010651 [Rhizoclosmatium hyalinum]
MSWNSTSQYFAASCDTLPWIILFDAHNNGEIVCRLDAGMSTYAVTFHPTNPYVLAFSNRLGYVHIVDLSSYLGENAKPVPEGERPPFVYPPRQVLRHDYQIPVEPRSGSYPDLTALTRVGGGVVNTGSGQGYLQESYSGLAAKINGILWSDDGRRLYVATNRRVLMHTVKEREVPSLFESVCRKVWDGGVEGLRESDPDAVEMLEEYSKRLLGDKRWANHWELD